MQQEANKLKEAYLESAYKFGIDMNLSIIQSIEISEDGQTHLLTLKLSNQNLNDEDLYPLLDALKKTKSAREVDLSHNQITDVSIFSDIVIMNKKLEILNLSHNPIQSSTISPLLESAFSSYSGIAKIDLSDSTTTLDHNNVRKVYFVQEEKEKTEAGSTERENLLSGMYFSFNPLYNKSPTAPSEKDPVQTNQTFEWKDFFIRFYNQALLDSYDGIVKTQDLVDLVILHECDNLMKSSIKLDPNSIINYDDLEKVISKLASQHSQTIDYEDLCKFFDNFNSNEKNIEEISLKNSPETKQNTSPTTPKTGSAIKIVNYDDDLIRRSSDSLSTIKQDSYMINGFENGLISRNMTEITGFSLNNNTLNQSAADDMFQIMLFPSLNSSPTSAMGEIDLKSFEAVNYPYKKEQDSHQILSGLQRNNSKSSQGAAAAPAKLNQIDQRYSIPNQNQEVSEEFKTHLGNLVNEIEALNHFVKENYATLEFSETDIVNQISKYHELVPSEQWTTSFRLAIKRIKRSNLNESKLFPFIKRVLNHVQVNPFRLKIPNSLRKVFKVSSSEFNQSSLAGMLGINLRVLNLSRNNIQNLKFLVSCRNLEFINLSHNQLTTVEGFILCPNLQEIILSNNKIDSIKTLARCANLRLLDLSFNKLQSVEQLQKLSLNKQLSVLNLNGNEVIWEKGYRIKLGRLLPNLCTLDPSYIIEHSNYKTFEDYAFNLKWTNPVKRDTTHSETLSQISTGDDSLLLRKFHSNICFTETIDI